MQAKEKGVTIKHFSLLSCSCFLFSRKRRLGNLTSLSLDQTNDGPYYRIAAFIMIWFDLTRELSDGNDWLAPFRLRLRRIFKLRSNIARIVKAVQCDCNVLVFSIVRNVNNFATSLGLSFEGVLKMYLSLSLYLSFCWSGQVSSSLWWDVTIVLGHSGGNLARGFLVSFFMNMNGILIFPFLPNLQPISPAFHSRCSRKRGEVWLHLALKLHTLSHLSTAHPGS